jgi:hypothetical protein
VPLDLVSEVLHQLLQDAEQLGHGVPQSVAWAMGRVPLPHSFVA